MSASARLVVLLVVAVPAAAERPAIRFEEAGEAAGARFVHSARSFGDRHKAQVLEMFTDGGAAVAVGDFDGDGHDDLFLTDSGEGKPNRLLRNLYGETGELRFADVTEAAGVGGGNDPRSIVADALWLDFDDDGRLDLLVARFGTPLLYRNLGAEEARAETSSAPTTGGALTGAEKHASLSPRGGRGTEGEGGNGYALRFHEVSAPAGLTKLANTIAAIAFDYDGDGWLDLLLGNYFPPEDLLALETRHVLPNDLDNAVNGGGVSLWRNVPGGSEATGGRSFVEVTEEAGLAHHTGWTLDLGHGDLDGDGDQDLYLAGDYGTDRLFLNRG
ncbi:MAG TPA: VCBS repeat-containing protein, partial [Thermoanaerobaculia bacterium]|nr:VCBS repeat-containing protein [Thermoanaerobaculia bacterium]